MGKVDFSETKLPPHSHLAEQAVIGGLLLDGAAWALVSNLLVEADFYARSHQYLFRAIRRLAVDGLPVDVLTVHDFLETKGYLEDVGGLAYIGMLAKDTPSAANVGSYAAIVKDRSLLRQLISLGNEIMASVYTPDGTDTDSLINNAETALFKLRQTQLRGRGDFVRLGDALRQELDDMEEAYANPPAQGVLGISTGFAALDEVTSGFQGGDLVVVAGRPSMGKSSLAMNFAESAAAAGKPVAVFTMEMSVKQLAQRLLAGASALPLRLIREPWTMNDLSWPMVTEGFCKISNLPMYLEESSAQTAQTIRALCMRLAAQLRQEHPAGLGMIVVDYLQLMGHEGRPGQHNRNEQISETTRALKGIAREFDVPLVLLSQLSRDVEKRANKRPILADLRDSGAIEQDADLVLFVYRDEKYNEDTPDKGVAEIIVGKHRNGALGTVRLGFDGYLTKFRDLG